MTEEDKISVVKRDGDIEKLNLDKIHRILETACEGITGVSVSDIEMKAHLSFYDGISTKDINKSLIKAAADLISEQSPNYQYVSANILNYELRKEVWGGKEPPKLFDHVSHMVKDGFYTEELLEYYSEDVWNELDNYIDHDRDFEFSYIGLKEYIDKYAVRDRSLETISPLETPQITYMLIAALSCLDTKSTKDIRKLYNDFSNWDISLPTPIMAGVRTPTKQFSSCTVISVDDTLDSIISGAGAIVKYVAKKAGIGLDVTRLRAEGSSVGKEKGIKHTGVTPFLRMFEGALKSCSQGGVRGGSMTTHVLIWHRDIEEFLVLKNNKGTPETRVRKMDYSIEISDYFYNRFVKNQNITLFSPRDVPGLYDAFFSDKKEFARLYEMYEKDESISKKVVSARDLFTKLIIERKETGRIYVFNVDNANETTPFDAPITTSNLCQEILLPTTPLKSLDDPDGLVSLCTLSAINLGNVKNLDDLESVCKNTVKTLDNLLDYQEYMIPAAWNATRLYRPLGIGVINLAYYLAKNGVSYSSTEGHKLIDDTMEAINYFCIKASIELAKERGVCEGYNKTKWSRGILPIDYYKKTIDDIVKFEPKRDWEWLRVELKKYGIRNATLTAFMPAESSAKISNATNGVEPIRSLITSKGNKSNNTKQVVPEITRLKNRYEMLWDMTTMDGVIKSMAIISRLCSQSISTNLSYNPAHYEDGQIPLSMLLKDLLKANHYGLPTLYYHNTPDNREENLVEEKKEVIEEVEKEEICDSCAI